MGYAVIVQHLLQPLKIMDLIALDSKPFHHMQNHIVIISADFLAVVSLRTEIAGNAQPLRMRNRQGRTVILYPLRNGNPGSKTLLLFTVKMYKPAHGVKQAPGDRKPQPQSAGKTAASGIRLIEIIAHLRKLRICHTDPGIANIYNQVYAIALLPDVHTDINAAIFRKLYGIVQKNLHDMRYFLHIAHQNRRHHRVQIENHFQIVFTALHGCHRNDIIQQRSDHIGFPRRNQRSLHNLRVVQHIINLVGQTLARHLDRLQI